MFCNKHQTAINAGWIVDRGSWIARFENNMGRGTQDAGRKDPVPCRQEKSDQIKRKCARCHSGILGATTSSGSMRHRLAISSSRRALFIWRGVAVAAGSVKSVIGIDLQFLQQTAWGCCISPNPPRLLKPLPCRHPKQRNNLVPCQKRKKPAHSRCRSIFGDKHSTGIGPAETGMQSIDGLASVPCKVSPL